ncbi:MAG: sodium:solute symporter family protein [bacterium]
MIQGIDILLVIIYFVLALGIGLISARKMTKEGFLIAERKLGVFSLTASISAGFLGGGLLVAYVSYVYQFGMSAIWIFAGIALGFLLLLVYHKRLKVLADKEEFYTISDYFKFKYGKNVGMISAIAVILYFLFFLIIEFIAGGRILSGILNIPYFYSVLIMALVVLIYLGLGGFKSVVKTDVFQYLVIVLFAAVIVFFVTTGVDFPKQELSLANAGIGNSIAFLILGAFATFMAPDLWQRIYASKNTKAAKISLYLTSVLIFLFGFVMALIGIVAKLNFPDILPDNALIFGLSNLLPAGILGLGIVMLFAAIMSSVDTSLFILGMNISEDIVRSRKEVTKDKLISLTRWSIIGFAIISVLVAVFIQNIISIALAFGSVSLALTPSLIGSFHFKLKSKAVFWSILMGIVSVILILASGYITPESSIVSLPVALVVLIIGQVLFKHSVIEDKS